MTLREKILAIITEALTADQETLSPEVLDEIAIIITDASDIADKSYEIFEQTDETFIEEVRTLFGRLTEATPKRSVFPKATNLVAFLTLVNQLSSDELDRDLPENISDFRIRETKLQAFHKEGSRLELFVYEHPTDIGESVAFMDLSAGFLTLNSSTNYPQKMTACVAILTGLESSELTEKRWIISKADEEKNLSYCKYHILLAGHLLTSPVSAPSTIALGGIAQTLKSSEEYKQFAEPFEILGEINSRTTVLDTLLSCYHVLENYMIRAKIVKVVDENSTPTLFGIRNFKQMAIAVEKSEQEHLDELFKSSWDKSIGQVTLEDYVKDRFDALFNNTDFVADDFHSFMWKLTVKEKDKKLDFSKPKDARDLLPKLIYKVRCSIVHNKETEFHLSNKELSSVTIKMILVELCIPSMQRLAFGLPSVASPNPVRYSQDSLKLY